MKTLHKNLLIAASLFLLAGAGCTQPATTSLDTDNANETVVNTTVTNTNEAVVENANAVLENTNTATGDTNDSDGETIDTSDWLAYTSEDYGFSFRYPSDYTVEIVSPGYELRIINNLGEAIKFYKQYYSEAGTNDALLFSKESLEELKEETEFRGKSNANNVIINSYYSYSIPGGNFYRGADFFLGNDYVRLSVPLNSGSTISSSEGEKINQYVELLNAGNGLSSDEASQMIILDSIISTVQAI